MRKLRLLTFIISISFFLPVACTEKKPLWPQCHNINSNWMELEVRRIHPDTLFLQLHDSIGDLSFFGRSFLVFEKLDTVFFKIQGGQIFSPLFILNEAQAYESLQIIETDLGTPIGLEAGKMTAIDTVIFEFQKIYRREEANFETTWIFSGQRSRNTRNEIWFVINNNSGIRGIWSVVRRNSTEGKLLFYSIIAGIGCFPSINSIDSIFIRQSVGNPICD